MTHLYYGDPNTSFSDRLAEGLFSSGADMLEMGIAYSDPVADGEVFQKACKRALDGGTNPYMVFKGIKKLREKGFKQPIYVTSYFGPVYKIGVSKFLYLVKKSGVQGAIIPDILFEEKKELQNSANKLRLNVIQFATPYSTNERLIKILKMHRDLYIAWPYLE